MFSILKFIFLFLRQNIFCGNSKELSQWDAFLSIENMFKLIDKKAIIISFVDPESFVRGGQTLTIFFFS